ncbi:MAG TPA: TlpA disulfide reductase family protein [Pseudomonadales bacterium]|jgi:thiol-disulfide isomerase/thioredoxin
MRISCIAASLLLCLAACSEKPTAQHGRLILADGTHQSLSDYRGHWVVINYWAIWCKPCLKEIPHFNRLARERTNDVVVFGVDFDHGRDDVLAERMNSMGIQFPLLLQDPASALDHPRPNVLPTTVIYDPQGNLAATLLGDQTWESLNQAIGTPP